MKKKLIKIRVCLGLDCSPRLDIVSYEDEMAPDERPYQSSKCPRNDKWEVEFGQIWLESSTSSSEPYWDSYMILEAEGLDNAKIAEKAKELYESSINQMKKDVHSLLEAVDGVKVPTMEEIMTNVENKTGSGVKPNGKYIVPIEVFKNLVKDRALEMGSENAEKLGYPVLDWSKFFGETITPDILSLLMKGLPVLKFNGDGIEFQTKEMFDQALSIVAVKLSSDVFARFVETRKEK